MKISPVTSVQNTVGAENAQASRVDKIRSLKMTTNATPLSDPLQETIPSGQELSISTSNEETTKPQEVTQPLSPQFAELARRRRSLQVKERELTEREKAFSEKSQAGNSVDLARLKQEPLSVLQEAGVTYDQLTEAILANQGNQEINALKAEIAALKEGVDKKFIDNETQAEQQVLTSMRREADLLVAQGDTFELLRETRSVPDVMRLIEQTYRKTGEVLDVSEACQLVEEELIKEAERMASLKKVQSRLQPSAPEPQLRQPGIRTLTNKHTASVQLGRKERAMAAFYGSLKK